MSQWKDLLQKSAFGKPKKSDWLVLALVGALLLILALPSGENEETDPVQTTVAETEENESQEEEASYASELEKRLKAVLSQMDGVGEVEVMITVADEGEHIVEKDVTVQDGKEEEATVYVEADDMVTPYVRQEKLPEITGVVVVAEGGGNAKTVSEISGAVQALFSVEAHRIKVVKMCSREESA